MKKIIHFASVCVLVNAPLAFAAETTTTTNSTPPTIASDRATYSLSKQSLHIPYTQLDDANKSVYSLDMSLTGVDNKGNYLFTLAPAQLNLLTKPHFTYDGEEGPQYWGGLTTDNTLCTTGKNQSPVDIKTNSLVSASLATIQFDYKTSALNILNNGHTVQANYDAGSGITVGGTRYELIQFHFHTPSEHTIDGQSSPMELHLVHISKDGGLAVVGVLLKTGKENTQLANVANYIPKTETPVATIPGVTIDANQLLPSQKN